MSDSPATVFRLRAEAAESRVRELEQALRTMVDCFGALHEEECPEDDTCACKWKPMNEFIDAALQGTDKAAKNG